MLIFTVQTTDKFGPYIHLETLNAEEARSCAQAIYDNQGIIAEIYERDAEPKSHDCRKG